VRLGTPAGTTRGFGIAEFQQIGDMIAEVLDAVAKSGSEQDAQAEERVAEQVKRLVGRFPIYEG
jgi:glycine hydroxymethyltransferase